MGLSDLFTLSCYVVLILVNKESSESDVGLSGLFTLYCHVIL